jgi:hypothetical protein
LSWRTRENDVTHRQADLPQSDEEQMEFNESSTLKHHSAGVVEMQSSEVNLVAQGPAAIGPMLSGEFQRDATSARRGCPFHGQPRISFSTITFLSQCPVSYRHINP